MDAVLQQLAWQRARSCCEYCHVPAEMTLLPFQLDHIKDPPPIGGSLLYPPALLSATLLHRGLSCATVSQGGR